jgi:hypothetical protein
MSKNYQFRGIESQKPDQQARSLFPEEQKIGLCDEMAAVPAREVSVLSQRFPALQQ